MNRQLTTLYLLQFEDDPRYQESPRGSRRREDANNHPIEDQTDFQTDPKQPGEGTKKGARTAAKSGRSTQAQAHTSATKRKPKTRGGKLENET